MECQNIFLENKLFYQNAFWVKISIWHLMGGHKIAKVSVYLPSRLVVIYLPGPLFQEHKSKNIMYYSISIFVSSSNVFFYISILKPITGIQSILQT